MMVFLSLDLFLKISLIKSEASCEGFEEHVALFSKARCWTLQSGMAGVGLSRLSIVVFTCKERDMLYLDPPRVVSSMPLNIQKASESTCWMVHFDI